MRGIEKTDNNIVISEDIQNKVLKTFISMKFDTVCNETTPAIILYRVDGYYEILTKMTSKNRPAPPQIFKLEKKRQIWNQRPLKRWRPLWRFLIRFYGRQKMHETYVSTTIPVTPLIHLLGQPQPQPWRRVLRAMFLKMDQDTWGNV